MQRPKPYYILLPETQEATARKSIHAKLERGSLIPHETKPTTFPMRAAQDPREETLNPTS